MTRSTVRTRGAEISYLELGAGKTVYVFLHYWGGSGRTWEAVMAKLAPGARCIALDARGWGRSQALDERYDLDAMADDAEDVVAALGLTRYVLVGHSMGGKVAQIVAARGAAAPAGLVLIAPAPPDAMPVSAEQRDAMLASYGSRAGVEQALSVLAGRPLSQPDLEQVVSDTLAGALEAKREWTERGMIAAVDRRRLRAFPGPVRIVVGERDRVERPELLRAAFADVLPQAVMETIPEIGHLSPLENPDAVASACRAIASELQP